MAFNSTPKDINEQNINGLLSCYAEWERVELNNIAKVVNGFAFKSADFNSRGKGNRLIRIRDILKGDTQTYFSGEVPDGYWVNEDDIIIGMDGDFNIAWWTGRPALLNQRVCKLDELTELFDQRFLFRLLPGYLDAVNANTSSTTVKHLSSKTLEELLLPLPPLAEQKVIADKLDALLTQVEITKTRLEHIPNLLKTFRQSILSAAVSGKLTEEWRDVNGFVINNWDQVLAADVCLKITDGEHQTPKRRSQGRMLLSAKNIRDGFIDYENHDLISEEDFNKCLKRCYAEINDVLIVSVGATIGRAAIKKDDTEFALVRSVGLFKIDPEKIIGDYLLYSLQSQKIQNFINEYSRGNAQQTLYIKTMAIIPIALPPLVEQREIVRRVEELFAFADSIEQKVNTALEHVNSLPQSILARAFRGDLTEDWRDANPELISGENSAKALLEKIKTERKIIEKQPKQKRTTVKKKTGSHMNKQIIKVVEALKHAGKPLSGQQLLEASGYPSDSNTDQLERFFLDIRDALTIEKSIVKLERDDDSQDWFALAQDSQQ
ncbi:restriction endonuclease subunit S [Acinetobacter seifertii]|uniref:Restriction endonuclease subunit S n=1 Tax=Acinetobacter seifertii TaxID=1530123 RepID=A0A7H2V7C6_9GAMM|nr:restriction endonuclease subunit S [Acinetobacter seifertii]MBZ6533256.1 restriction endonuclease subunit S [Acinetobacter seifertii]QNX72259.1 restriction endonuclease subunit S [Acinetobacter seifertii]